MKNIFCLLLSMIAFTSCYTLSMSGDPAAVSAGASIGGMLGSIVGDRAGGWQGSQFGALVGTVAGAAVGNAVTTPRTEKIPINEKPEMISYYAPSRLRITNIRFIDDNRNHTIDAEENCKLVFDILNEGDVSAYNITPIIEEVSGIKHIGISPSVQISYLPQGDKVRYTTTIVGGKRLKSGEAVFRVYTTESNGAVSDAHEFALPTQKRVSR
ncbi:MAG: hypothetical protein IKW37_08470 [Bacteroidaceae bacterium]|nr:hypothetical protein [Bacteroidaceae bacterium]